MLGSSPVHFTDQNKVSWDDNGYIWCLAFHYTNKTHKTYN